MCVERRHERVALGLVVLTPDGGLAGASVQARPLTLSGTIKCFNMYLYGEYRTPSSAPSIVWAVLRGPSERERPYVLGFGVFSQKAWVLFRLRQSLSSGCLSLTWQWGRGS